MSVVCCKVEKEKIQIASDSISIRGATQRKGDNKYSKLFKVNGLIIGGVGKAEETSLLICFCSTRKPSRPEEESIVSFFSEFAEWKKKQGAEFNVENHYLMIFKNKAFAIEHFFVQEITGFEAIGAGMDFALAALHLGHDVKKAVEVACELSIYCEKPVQYFEINRSIS